MKTNVWLLTFITVFATMTAGCYYDGLTREQRFALRQQQSRQLHEEAMQQQKTLAELMARHMERDKQPATIPSLPQAKPFLDMLEAVKDSDGEKFKNVFSKPLRESNQPWDNKVVQAKMPVNARYGDCDLTQFTFEFVGDDTHGDLTVSYKDKLPTVSKVVKEGEEWKLATH